MMIGPLGINLGMPNRASFGGVALPFSFNLKKSNTAAVRAVYQAGARNTIVATFGDSTVRGTDETADPYNSQFPSATFAQLAALFNAAGKPAGANNLFGSGTTTIADLKLRDSRFDHTGGAVFGSVQTQGGADFNFPSVASSFSVAFPGEVDTGEIYWRDAATGRNFSWDVGGAATQINSSNVSQMKKDTVALGALGLKTLRLNWVAGSVNIFGVNAYNSARKELSFFNWGVNGATSATLVGNVGVPNGGRLQFITSFPPDLAIVEIGPNDWRNSVSVATMKANVLTLITALKTAGATVILFAPPFDGSSTGLVANQNAYVTALYELAVSEDVPLVDPRLKWASYANQAARGLTGDFVHPTVALGYPDLAAILYPTINYAISL